MNGYINFACTCSTFCGAGTCVGTYMYEWPWQRSCVGIPCVVVLRVTFTHCFDVACFLTCCLNVLRTQHVYSVLWHIMYCHARVVCRDMAAARAILNMWKKQFVSSAAVPHQLWPVLLFIHYQLYIYYTSFWGLLPRKSRFKSLVHNVNTFV